MHTACSGDRPRPWERLPIPFEIRMKGNWIRWGVVAPCPLHPHPFFRLFVWPPCGAPWWPSHGRRRQAAAASHVSGESVVESVADFLEDALILQPPGLGLHEGVRCVCGVGGRGRERDTISLPVSSPLWAPASSSSSSFFFFLSLLIPILVTHSSPPVRNTVPSTCRAGSPPERAPQAPAWRRP